MDSTRTRSDSNGARRADARRNRMRQRRLAAVFALAVLVTACGADTTSDSSTADASTPRAAVSNGTTVEAETADTWEIPGDTVFPEGIAVDPNTDSFYIGSTDDGAVYRGDVADPDAGTEVFLDAGVDNRTTVTGLWVDDAGRLFVAGRDSNRFFVYDTVDGSLLADFELPETSDTLLNDVVVTADGAYVTDSFRPTLFRIPLDGDQLGEMEPWLDLDQTAIAYESGFNLNGIVASDDETTLLTVQYNTGELFAIDTTSGEVTPVDLGDEALETGDGLVLDGTRLQVVLGGPGEIVTIELDDDFTAGEIVARTTRPEWRAPTTIAATGDRLLVVNSQLNMTSSPDEASLPFTVTAVDIPETSS